MQPKYVSYLQAPNSNTQTKQLNQHIFAGVWQVLKKSLSENASPPQGQELCPPENKYLQKKLPLNPQQVCPFS